MVVQTGVFASPEELTECQDRSRLLASHPLIFPNGIRTAEALDRMFEQASERIDELAVAHGLPKPGLLDGAVSHYGMSNAGEFTRWEP